MRLTAWLALAVAVPALAAPDGSPSAPVRSRTVPEERVRARLVQIHVTVEGPSPGAWGLGPGDFALKVGGQKITGFAVNNACAAGEGASGAPAVHVPASLVFFFDELQLSPMGRARALAIARDLVASLVQDGNRGMVVSSARRLRIAADWTTDPTVLNAALDDVERNPADSDDSVAREPIQASRLTRELEVLEARLASDFQMIGRSGSPSRPSPGSTGRDTADVAFESGAALTRDNLTENATRSVAVLAWDYQTVERQRSSRSVERLTGLLARLSETPAPKAIVYFADAFRRNPGEHYFAQIREAAEWNRMTHSVPGMEKDLWLAQYRESYGADGILGPLMHEAAAKNVRFYTVQAEGLVDTTGRVRDAQATLAAISLETGGEAFLNGIPSDKVAARIGESLRCSYILSFDPEGLAEDRPLDVVVATKRPGLTLRSQGRIVVESEARRAVSRLVAAALGGADSHGTALSVGTVPLGWEKGKFSALLQVVAPPSGPTQDWELATTRTTAGGVDTGEAGRLAAPGPVPVALEEVVSFPSGPYEVLALGRDLAGDQVVSSRVAGTWPDLDSAPVSLSAVAFVQPMAGAFLRAGEVKRRGLIVLAEAEPVNPRASLAILVLVCRSAGGPRALRVGRKISGEIDVPLPDVDVDLGAARCAQVRDFVPPATLGSGRFVYRLEVIDGTAPAASGERPFEVLASQEGAAYPEP